MQRHERYATCIGTSFVAAIVSPEQLLTQRSAPGRGALPAMKLFTGLQPWFVEHRLAGGPTGSIGFELVSGIAVVSRLSDLDLLLRPSEPFTRTVAQQLCASLQALARQAGCRVDVQVEGEHGAFGLADYVLHERIMLRTSQGASLSTNPWRPID
jgi:phosphoribosyl-dephospho-CoA transferase